MQRILRRSSQHYLRRRRNSSTDRLRSSACLPPKNLRGQQTRFRSSTVQQQQGARYKMITEVGKTQTQIGIDSFAAAYDDASLAVSTSARLRNLVGQTEY